MDYTSSSSNYSHGGNNYNASSSSNASSYSSETTLEHTTNYKLDPCCHRGCPGCPYK